MTVHAEADDKESTLCGKAQTRDDPVTTRDDFENVDCLECVMLLQSKGMLP